MKALHLLIIIVLFATPLYGQQALVLTEIEQIQEKIWYLQRDLAAQKDTLEKQKGQLTILANQLRAGDTDLSGQLETLTQSLSSITEDSAEAEANFQLISESLVDLTEKVDKKDQTILEMSGKIGALEGFLQGLRSELAAQQARHEQALNEIRAQLGELRSQLEAMKQNDNGPYDQVGLWGAVGGLAVAVLLTIIFALKGTRSKRYDHKDGPPRHEL